MNIEIYPLEKVVIDGTAICFGMNQSDVETAIGKGQITGKRHYYFDNEMAIDYNENGTVAFIEFLGGIDGNIQPVIYGKRVFETKADDLYDVLSEKNNGEIVDDENGYAYSFLNISVGIYRSSIPENVQKMIMEAEKDGVPMKIEDIQYEMRKAEYWNTIGSGTEGYYSDSVITKVKDGDEG